MRIKDYFEEGNVIITDDIRTNYAPFLTTDGQDTINNTFLYEYGTKELYFDNVYDIEKVTQYTLTKYFLEYTKLNDLLEQNIPTNALRTLTRNESGENEETDKQTGTTSTTTDSTRTDDLTDTRTDDLTSTNTKDLTDTRTVDLTDTDTKNLTYTKGTTETNNDTKSEKAFDGTDWVQTEQNTGTKAMTGSDTDTGTDEIKHTGTDTNAQTGTDTNTNTGTQENKHTGTQENNTNVSFEQDLTNNKTGSHSNEMTETETGLEIIDALEKYKEFYKFNLYNRIVDDLKDVLLYRTWHQGWINL